MKALDGWKTWISAVAWIGVAAWALISGQDLTPIAKGVADGTLTAGARTPVVLKMTDAPPTEAKAAPIVAVMIAEPTPTPEPASKPAPLPVR